ncbi:MAG: hypothetical protein ACETWE_10480, partial [Candidatus Bathyarchaeia archaeon]
MVDRLRIGVLGLVHDHVWDILDQFKDVEDAEVTCASDVNEPLLAKARESGMKSYRSHEDLLSEEDIHAVIVYTEN